MVKIVMRRWMLIMLMVVCGGVAFAQDPSSGGMEVDSVFNSFGMDLFETDIDNIIFATNDFVTDTAFTGTGGPFWWILEMCLALGALFSIIVGAGMAYKMMVKGEPFDPMKILRILGISMVMMMWYGNSTSICSVLAYIPNAIGSYTHDLYSAESLNVQDTFNRMTKLLRQRDERLDSLRSEVAVQKDSQKETNEALSSIPATGGTNTSSETTTEITKKTYLKDIKVTFAGILVAVDKLVMFFSMIFWKVGWWGTMFCQQLLLGMLTIFGPIQWAFSILPKWEGAWAKWTTRYLTVHFYGAMLYFVGFYVLLLYDIVLNVQCESLAAIVSDGTNSLGAYVQSAFMTAGYLLVASIVSLKCLNFVPDLAAWMIPEGDTAFSARSFGEGVASQTKASTTSMFK